MIIDDTSWKTDLFDLKQVKSKIRTSFFLFSRKYLCTLEGYVSAPHLEDCWKWEFFYLNNEPNIIFLEVIRVDEDF